MKSQVFRVTPRNSERRRPKGLKAALIRPFITDVQIVFSVHQINPKPLNASPALALILVSELNDSLVPLMFRKNPDSYFHQL